MEKCHQLNHHSLSRAGDEAHTVLRRWTGERQLPGLQESTGVKPSGGP